MPDVRARQLDGDALEQEMRAAFRHVAKPSAKQIAPHVCLECDELRNELHPYGSEDLPPEVLDRHCWDLPLLSDDAKQYYLPAWIARSIDDPQSDHTQALLFALDSDHRWKPTTPYTERQWRVLETYLDYLAVNADRFTLGDIAKARKRLKGGP